MTDINILWITLVLYIIGMVYSYYYDKRMIMFISVLWFVPVFLIQNTIIIVFCIVMFLLHVIIPIQNKGDDF